MMTLFPELQIASEEKQILKTRRKEWTQFLDDNYYILTNIHTSLSYAVIETSRNYPELFNQNVNQFSRSKSLIFELFKEGRYVRKLDNEAGKYFLLTVLIYGSYPEYHFTDIHQAQKALRNFSLTDLRNFFLQLFGKYKQPEALLNHLHLLSESEIKLVLSLLNGQNIRTSKSLPITVSKKESYIFINQLPENLLFDNNILLRLIISTKLLKHKSQSNELTPFLNNCRTFLNDPKLFYQEIDFWKDVFQIIPQLNNHSENTDHFQHREWIDFFMQEKLISPNICIRKRSLENIIRDTINWHENQYNHYIFEDLSETWEVDSPNEWLYRYQEQQYSITEINSLTDLNKEGKELQHCVYSYAPDIQAKHCRIFSLKILTPEIKRLVTIEVNGDRINQAKGFNNRAINSTEKHILSSWAGHKNFTTNL